MSRLTQKNYVELWLREKVAGKYIPIYEFIGEKYIRSLGLWVLLSHRAPARVTDLFYEGKLDRRLIKGKSHAYYYEYKMKEGA